MRAWDGPEEKLTREGFIDSIDTLERHFIGVGAKISFGPNDHQGLEQVYFTKIKEGRVSMFTDWKELNKG